MRQGNRKVDSVEVTIPLDLGIPPLPPTGDHGSSHPWYTWLGAFAYTLVNDVFINR